MKRSNFIRFLSIILAIGVILVTFTACTSEEQPQQTVTNNQEQPKNPLTHPSVKDKHITPDLSKVKVPKASGDVTSTDTPEKLLKALEAFVNPNGNEYDALSIIGEFRYEEEGTLLLRQLKTAAKAWHEIIDENVGEKCVVSIKHIETRKVDMSDKTVTEWNNVNGKTAEDYAKITCEIGTNYASDTLTYIFEAVKVDGSWYLSTIGTLDKMHSIIATDIYR